MTLTNMWRVSISATLIQLLSSNPVTASNCTADSSGTTDASSAIQYCLNNSGGGTVTLASGGTYLIDHTLTLTVSYTTLTTDGGSNVVLKAGANLQNNGGRILHANADYFTLSYLTLMGQGDPNGLHYYKGTPSSMTCFTSENARADGTGFLIDHVESKYAPCNSGLIADGTAFTIQYSYVHDNGFDINASESCCGHGSWADGITVGNCDSCSIHDNTINDNTDINLIVGGGINGDVESNSISATSKHAFGGLMIGWFPSGNGNHSGAIYQYNTITSGLNKLAYGIMVGNEPWYDPNYPGRQFVTNAGSVINNTVSGAVVNLALDGVGAGTITGNTLSSHQGTAGFQCSNSSILPQSISVHYAAGATVQGSPAHLWFYHGGCGVWNSLIPQEDSPSALTKAYLSAGTSLDSNDGLHHLYYQGTDGNLVLYDNSFNPLWNACTQHSPFNGYIAIMQSDGNFVVYNNAGSPVFNTGTSGHDGAYLVVGDNGYLYVVDLSGNILWLSGTNCH